MTLVLVEAAKSIRNAAGEFNLAVIDQKGITVNYANNRGW